MFLHANAWYKNWIALVLMLCVQRIAVRSKLNCRVFNIYTRFYMSRYSEETWDYHKFRSEKRTLLRPRVSFLPTWVQIGLLGDLHWWRHMFCCQVAAALIENWWKSSSGVLAKNRLKRDSRLQCEGPARVFQSLNPRCWQNNFSWLTITILARNVSIIEYYIAKGVSRSK